MIVHHRGLLRHGRLGGQRGGGGQRLNGRLALQRTAAVAVQRGLAGQMRDRRVRRVGRSALSLAAEQIAAGRRLVGALRMHVLELDRGQFGYGQIRQIRRAKRENKRNPLEICSRLGVELESHEEAKRTLSDAFRALQNLDSNRSPNLKAIVVAITTAERF